MTVLPTAANIFERLPRFFRRHRLMRWWMRLTGENPLQLVRIRGEAFGLADMNEGFLRLIVIDQHFEEDFFHLADALLERGGTFLDIGANYGLLSFGLASRHGERVDFHLFEPNPNVVAAIRQTMTYYPGMRCKVNALAVSDRDGTVAFEICPEHTGVSRVVVESAYRVPAVTLDNYCAREKISRIALIKMDVEGHELSVLHGARRLLESKRIDAIYFEYMEKNLGQLSGAVLNFLRSVNYEVCFCRRGDIEVRAPASHTICLGEPGHGLAVLPISGWPMPPATDLLSVPKDRLVAITK